jgi:hypothetical protein
VDASRKIFCGIENLLFDFELFIGEQYELMRADNSLEK